MARFGRRESYKLWTGPIDVARVATMLEKAGLPVVSVGTEHVYLVYGEIPSGTDPADVKAGLHHSIRAAGWNARASDIRRNWTSL